MALGRKPIEIVNEGSHQLLVKAKHWKRIYLRKVAIVQNGYAFSSKNFVKIGGMPLIRIRDIDRELTVDRFDGNYSDQFIVRNGDILIGMDGDFKISKWKGGNALLNQRVCRIIPNSDEFDSNFLFLCMQPFLDAIHQETSSVTVKHLSSRTIEEIPLPFPPLLEQQKIVTKIEELFSQLENGKQQLLTAQKQLKTYRQSLLKSAFEGKLTNQNLKAGELPQGWTKVQIKDVASTIRGYAFKSGEFLNNGAYQVLRMGNVRSGLIRHEESPVFLNDAEESVLKRSLLHLNDVIITQTGTRKKRDYGYTALIQQPNLLLNQRIASIRFRENYLPKFFLYFSWTDSFRDQFFENETGNVGQGNVGIKAVTETLIPYCSIKDQIQIVSEIESKLTICDKIEETIKNTLQQSETLRQSILKKAFEGRLV